MTAYEVAEYLSAASAGGIVGNAAYAGVQGLAAWMRDRLTWRPDVPLSADLVLTVDELAVLSVLFDAAKREWLPGQVSSINATQNVRAGRDISAPVTNVASSTPSPPWTT